MQQLSINQRAQRWKDGSKVAIIVVGGAVAAPIAALSIVGVAGLAVAGAIGCLAISFAPVFSNMVGNWVLKGMKAEARRNPVETLQTEYLQRAKALSTREQAIKQFRGIVTSYNQKLDKFQQKHPNNPQLADMQDYSNKLQQLLKNRVDKYQESVSALATFAEVIEQAGDMWEVMQVAYQADDSIDVELAFKSKLKSDTALDTIQTRINEVFGDLDTMMDIRIQEPTTAKT